MRDGTNLPKANDGEPPPHAARARWLSVLAQADPLALDKAWNELDPRPSFRHLRPPETGLALLRGRMGGVGERFNLGEMSLSRCSVALSDGQGGEVAGHGHVAGCSLQQAERVALFDALMQLPEYAKRLEDELILPLEKAISAAKRLKVETAQASRVEFFTVVRGE
ncbi:carbon-phosphorus lyase complex subunit [Rhodospirillaceae bacterium LM-1]|nr:carbon-phosphorus lyase complex subunit [Rhodospirillaceae bacterium LM-1]